MIRLSTARLTRDGVTLVGEEPASMLDYGNDDFIQTPFPVNYELKAVRVTNGALVTGKATTRLRCVCGFCLKPYEVEIVTTDICHFYENPLKPEIDLTPDVREDILLDFPRSLSCGEDCAGIPDAAATADVAPAPPENSRWAALNELESILKKGPRKTGTQTKRRKNIKE